MALIFRIAAGIIIGLLGAEIILSKMAERKYVNESQTLYAAQALNTNGVLLTQSLQTYVDEHGSLPSADATLDCTYLSDCLAGRQGDIYYVSYKGEWLSLEPRLVDQKIDYACRISVKSVYVPLSPKFGECRDLNKAEVPAFSRRPTKS